MIEFREVLSRLSKSRPVFHSEADFQHALAWSVQQLYPMAELRLEVPFLEPSKKGRMDIVVRRGSESAVVELKYKTRRGQVEVGDETFRLGDHLAQDFGRYDFLKDVVRIEAMVKRREFDFGYAILLTNDPVYWTEPSGDSNDAAFHFPPTRRLTGDLTWGVNTGEGTRRERAETLRLTDTYECSWHDFSNVPLNRYPAFRFLLLRTSAQTVE